MLNRFSHISDKRPRFSCLLVLLTLVTIITVNLTNLLQAQDLSESITEEHVGEERTLTEIQRSISARYTRFSKTLIQLHGYMKENDPARAELLMRVIGKSNEARVDAQLDILLQLFNEENPQFGNIVERQADLIQSLANLLDLLQSEDERQRIADEIARIEELIGDINKIVVEQKEVRAGTERGKESGSLGQQQSEVTENTTDLAEKMEQQDRERKEQNEKNSAAEAEKTGKSATPKQGENPESEAEKKSENSDQPQNPADEQKPDEESPENGSPSNPSQKSKPTDKNSSPQQGQQPQNQQPQNQQPMPEQESGESSENEPQNSEQQKPQPQQNQTEPTPGREEVESAIEKMQRAIEELKQQNRDQASREQDQAIAELEKAKAKLEEILRQLREEEQKILLAALEARFRKMLQMQVTVRKASEQIQEIPVAERLPRHRARATQLARDEQEIVIEADKALILLREEGTSVAFPEAVLQIREDMVNVAERLNGFVVDELTIAIEDDIIEALDEMVEALRKEMEKLEKKEQEGEQQQGEPEDPGLVDLIAELKLLRSLQYRVNRRTQLLGRQIDGEQAVEPELRDLLSQLSARQARIQRATYDLSTGRNN